MQIYDSFFQFTNQTATAGTEIPVVIPANGPNLINRVMYAQYRADATAHTLSMLRPAATTTLSAESLATDTTLDLTAIARLGGDVAANDYIVFKDANGNWFSRKVSGISTNTITVPAVTTDLAAGTTIYLMGAVGTAHNASLPCTASIVNYFPGGIFQGGYSVLVSTTKYERSGNGDPLLLVSNNATNAGNWEVVSGCRMSI